MALRHGAFASAGVPYVAPRSQEVWMKSSNTSRAISRANCSMCLRDEYSRRVSEQRGIQARLRTTDEGPSIWHEDTVGYHVTAARARHPVDEPFLFDTPSIRGYYRDLRTTFAATAVLHLHAKAK